MRMNEPRKELPPVLLTKSRRRAVCIHEAAHAVIYRLGGAFVHQVAVAPEGAGKWTHEGRKGGILDNLWGVCSISDPPFLLRQFVRWNEDSGEYDCDRRGFSSAARIFESETGLRRFAAETRRQVRSCVCGLLAGPIAEQFFEGDDDPWLEPDFADGPGNDLMLADAYARVLPGVREYDHLCNTTSEALRRPDIWQKVISLADELERVGEIEDVDPFLPEWDRSWPPPPPRRRAGK